MSGAAQSIPYQMDWLAERVAGEPIANPCVISAPIDCGVFGVEM